MDLKLLYCCIIVLCGFQDILTNEVTNDCGTLSIAEPALLNRNVSFTFVPSLLPELYDSVVWYILSSSGNSQVNAKEYYTYRNDSTFYMVILNANSNKNYTHYHIQYRDTCSSPAIRLHLTELVGCGLLFLHTSSFREGDDVEIGYFPPQALLNLLNRYVRYWIHNSSSCSVSEGCILDLHSGMYKERQRLFNQEYVLVLHNISTAMDGDYRIRCTENRTENKFTKTIKITVPVKPSKPTLQPLQSFPNIAGCVDCIVAPVNTNEYIWCNTTGGTTPVNVNIYIDGVLEKTSTTTTGHGFWKTFEDSAHMTEVRCEVSNAALTSPLVKVSRLYVMLPPKTPDLFLQDLKEGHLVNISCISTDARPAPKVKIYISDTEANSTETITHENLTDAFTSMAVLDKVKREWNGLRIKCCISHATNKTDNCTRRTFITYLYPPVAVSITPPEPIHEDYAYHMINLTCNVVDANPVCGAVWNVSDKLVVDRRNGTKIKTLNNGFSTSASVILNVSKADIGTKVTCRADCAEFASEKRGLYVIQVPYAPVIAINVSSEVEVAKGETINVKCSAESIPKSTIKWMYKDNETAVPSKHSPACDVHSACLRIESSTTDNGGLYTCIAINKVFGLRVASVTIKVIDVDPEVDILAELFKNVTLWAIAGTLAFLCILSIVVVVVIIKKRKPRVSSSGSGQQDVQYSRPNAGQDEHNDIVYIGTATPEGDEIKDEVYHQTVFKENEDHGDANGDVNGDANADVNAEANVNLNVDDTGVTYAGAIPKSQRQTIQRVPENDQQELVYADLDIQPSISTTLNPAVRRDSPTEYVSIDFTRKADTIDVEENVYANQ